ncbi:RND superfamily putative drug exporter [Streptomyces afghaniensis]|nr:RND superfamily putative drug exporter [Streptomyces afghaniensis]
MIATTVPATGRAGVFGRLAFWSQRHRWSALLLWILAVAVIAVGAQSAGSAYRNDFTLPGTDSQAAADLLKQHGSAQAGASVQIVFKDTDGLSGDRPAIEQTLDRVRGLPGVADVRSPYADASAVSEDGTIGYATVVLDAKAEEVPEQDVTRIVDTAKSAAQDGLLVELGGDVVRGAEEESGGGAEGAGMLAALIILVLLFGSLVAAALPLVTALFAVGGAIGLITMASHVFTVADFTPPIMMLVGLGVGVDYALLIFYRFRHELTHGADRQTATRTALDTAGRTVFFAGCTVIIALLGLVALGLGSLQGVAVAVTLTVLVTMAASLTLLPALLALFGDRIQRQVVTRSAKAQAKGREEGGRWRRLASTVQRRPLPALLAAVVVLLALCAPALGMRLGFADAGNDPASSTSRRAYDLLAEGFGAGFNGPLLAVSRGDADAAEQLRTTLTGTEGIAAATPPLPSPDGTVFTVIAFPTTSPQDASTAGLVHTLRDDVLPRLAERTGADYLVGGPTAAAQDFTDAVSARIPLFVAIVVGLSALLLMLVFRSVLIPLKAAVLKESRVLVGLRPRDTHLAGRGFQAGTPPRPRLRAAHLHLSPGSLTQQFPAVARQEPERHQGTGRCGSRSSVSAPPSGRLRKVRRAPSRRAWPVAMVRPRPVPPVREPVRKRWGPKVSSTASRSAGKPGPWSRTRTTGPSTSTSTGGAPCRRALAARLARTRSTRRGSVVTTASDTTFTRTSSSPATARRAIALTSRSSLSTAAA